MILVNDKHIGIYSQYLRFSQIKDPSHDVCFITSEGGKIFAHKFVLLATLPQMSTLLCDDCIRCHEDVTILLPHSSITSLKEALSQVYVSNVSNLLRKMFGFLALDKDISRVCDNIDLTQENFELNYEDFEAKIAKYEALIEANKFDIDAKYMKETDFKTKGVDKDKMLDATDNSGEKNITDVDEEDLEDVTEIPFIYNLEEKNNDGKKDGSIEYGDLLRKDDTTTPTQDGHGVSVETSTAPDLPEHTFVKKMIAGKTGRMKGKNRITFTLFMGPHTYKWRFKYKENHYFSCTDCLKHNKTVNAIAHRVLGDTPEEDQHFLQYAPPFEEHACQQNGLETIIKVAKLEMRKKVQEDPNKPIPQIYKEIFDKSFKSLDEFGQTQLAEQFPSFRHVQSELYKERRYFIPQEPVNYDHYDVDIEEENDDDVKDDRLKEYGDFLKTNDVDIKENTSAIFQKNESVEEPLPPHRFIKKIIFGKTGSMKGITRTIFDLIVGHHMFRRSKGYKSKSRNVTYFYCCTCLKMKIVTTAVAEHIPGKCQEDDQYVLIRAPKLSEHACDVTSNVEVSRTIARCKLTEKVQREPTKKISQIYEEAFEEVTREYQNDEALLMSILDNFPPFKDIEPQLHRERNQVMEIMNFETVDKIEDEVTLAIEKSKLPRHKFIKKKLSNRTVVSLIVGTFIYKRSNTHLSYFYCNRCSKLGKQVYAKAVYTPGKVPGEDDYELVNVPDQSEHVCNMAGTNDSKKIMSQRKKQQVPSATSRSCFTKSDVDLKELMEKEEAGTFFNSDGEDSEEKEEDARKKLMYKEVEDDAEEDSLSLNNSAQNNEIENPPVDDPLPQHKFIKKKMYGKFGSMKGVNRIIFSLIIGPHLYSKDKNYKGLAYFRCTSCEKEKVFTSAIAKHVPGKVPEEDEYILTSAPKLSQHACNVTSYAKVYRTIAMCKMREKVQQEPTKKISEVYDETFKELVEEYGSDETIIMSIMESLQSLKEVQPNLYEERNHIRRNFKTEGNIVPNQPENCMKKKTKKIPEVSPKVQEMILNKYNLLRKAPPKKSMDIEVTKSIFRNIDHQVIMSNGHRIDIIGTSNEKVHAYVDFQYSFSYKTSFPVNCLNFKCNGSMEKEKVKQECYVRLVFNSSHLSESSGEVTLTLKTLSGNHKHPTCSIDDILQRMGKDHFCKYLSRNVGRINEIESLAGQEKEKGMMNFYKKFLTYYLPHIPIEYHSRYKKSLDNYNSNMQIYMRFKKKL